MLTEENNKTQIAAGENLVREYKKSPDQIFSEI